MPEDNIQKQWVDEKTTDKKKDYNRWKWLEKIKQFTRRKNYIDKRPLTKEEATIEKKEYRKRKKRYSTNFGPWEPN